MVYNIWLPSNAVINADEKLLLDDYFIFFKAVATRFTASFICASVVA